jgi:MFS family permease
MIALTYCTSAVLLAVSGWLFNEGALTAQSQTVLWCVIFFIASAAASSAYLTVSEIFPVEMRAQSIALIFAIAQVIGGIGSAIFGMIVAAATHEEKLHTIYKAIVAAAKHDEKLSYVVQVVVDRRGPLAWGYAGAAAIMFIGGLVAWFLGVDAEQKSLEDIAPPIAATEAPHVTPSEIPDGPHPPPHKHPHD